MIDELLAALGAGPLDLAAPFELDQEREGSWRPDACWPAAPAEAPPVARRRGAERGPERARRGDRGKLGSVAGLAALPTGVAVLP